MASLGELYNMRSDCRNRLANQQHKLRKYEDAYDSLVAFKDTASQSHSAFDESNSSKQQYLLQLNDLASTCRSAKEYAAGSNHVFNRIGTFIVGQAYYGLEGSVTLKLGAYRVHIANTEATIYDLENQIQYLNTLIAAAQAEAEGDEL